MDDDIIINVHRTKHVAELVSFDDVDTLYVDIETYSTTGVTDDAVNPMLATPRLITVRSGTHIHIFDMLFVPWAALVYLINKKKLVGHNMMFDYTILRKNGVEATSVECTMLKSQVLVAGLPPDLANNGLEACLMRYLNTKIDKTEQLSDWSRPDLSESQYRYAANDVRYLPILNMDLDIRLAKYKLDAVATLECGVLPAIVDMKLYGIRIDKEQWIERSKEAEKKAQEAEDELLSYFPLPPEKQERAVIYTRKGTPRKIDIQYNLRVQEYNRTRKWNLGSPIQLMEMLATKDIKLSTTKYEVLSEMALDFPILDKVLEWREAYKEATTFGKEWLKHCLPNSDRVHPDWRQIGAEKSGRMSCGDPNMQQVPRGKCRNGIIASEGHLLVRADYSQIEARIAAKISKDEILIHLFNSGGDIHAYTASQVLEKPIESITKAERQIGKSLLFGLLFSMAAPKLRVYCATNYGVRFTPEQAVIFRDRFFRTFPGIANWHSQMRRTCNERKEFRTLMGRRRLIGYSATDQHVNRLGLSLNHPVQGSAADLLKVAVHELWLRREERPNVKRVMLVHDEIVLESPEAEAEDTGKWLRNVMIDAGSYMLNPVPVDAEVKIGRTWGG